MRRIGLTLALLAAACAPVNRPAPAVTDTRAYDAVSIKTVAARAPDLVQAYAAGSPHQTGELRVPKGRGPFPVAMLVHGGCYTAGLGSTSDMGGLASWLADHGVASWTIDYRELGSGGGWPTTFEDWAAGLAHLKVLAKDRPLDLARISVIGHSAGGTAAAWLASGNRGDAIVVRDLPRVRSAVVVDGPPVLSEMIGVDAAACGKPVIVPLMGGTPEQLPSRYMMVDPRRNALTVKRFTLVAAAMPASSTVLDDLSRRGIATELVTLPDRNHFDMLVPGTRSFAAFAPALLRATGGK